MSCTPANPCGPPVYEPVVAPVRPPGLTELGYRFGSYDRFAAAIVRAGEHAAGRTPGAERWDIGADPLAGHLVALWAYMAETVNGAVELAANESFLPTAADPDDLRHIAALTGFTPRPRVAATGWVRVETDAAASPLLPEGTQMQAPAAAPSRPNSQTFETLKDASLRADWGGLTATQVPKVEPPDQRSLRFMGDPGFSNGDLVLFVDEPRLGPLIQNKKAGWFDFAATWFWFLRVPTAPAVTPLMLARVVERTSELGTTVVTFDRDLQGVLTLTDHSYAAYRVRATTGIARTINVATPWWMEPPDPVPNSVSTAIGLTSVVLDAALDDVSAGSQVAVVWWKETPVPSTGSVLAVKANLSVQFEITRGTTVRLSQLTFADGLPSVLPADTAFPLVYVLDQRVPVRHHTFGDAQLGAQVRIFPAPAEVPERLAVRLDVDGEAVWTLLHVAGGQTEGADLKPDQTVLDRSQLGMVLTLAGNPPRGRLHTAPATGNVVAVRHGMTTEVVLGDGDRASVGQELSVPDAPVASDLGVDGTPAFDLVVRVDGERWDPVASLYGRVGEPVYRPVADAAGAVVARFGARLPSGQANVRARYRVGGGLVGEVPGGAIDTLLGSIDGVREVHGVGPTTGGSDQTSPAELRRAAPGRCRAFDRLVSIDDAVDLALGFPGVSHAAAWRGAPPSDSTLTAASLHLVFLRTASGGIRVPAADEVAQLQAYLDARRDTLIALSVGAASVVPVTVAATVVADPHREAGAVADAARQLLVDVTGPLGALNRRLGQVLDRSDVVELLHRATGVVGVTGFSLTRPKSSGGASTTVPGRLAADRDELLVPGTVTFVGESA